MALAVVLRLLDGPLAEGELAGWVEVVATGERRAVRNGEELLSALRAIGATSDRRAIGAQVDPADRTTP